MFAIIVAGYAGPPWPDEASSFLRGPAILIGIGGWVLFVGDSLGSLGRRPRSRDPRLVRHPIYGGLILITLGWSLGRYRPPVAWRLPERQRDGRRERQG
jgi:hypothetical protein